jgi:hypothetical protein
MPCSHMFVVVCTFYFCCYCSSPLFTTALVVISTSFQFISSVANNFWPIDLSFIFIPCFCFISFISRRYLITFTTKYYEILQAFIEAKLCNTFVVGHISKAWPFCRELQICICHIIFSFPPWHKIISFI